MSQSTPLRGGRTAAQAADLALSPAVVGTLREHLPEVASAAITEIMEEVPLYNTPFQGRMGRIIEKAVQTSLGTFLEAASAGVAEDGTELLDPGVQAAHELGRGEARNGRPIDALLAAYRVGARVSWRELSHIAVEHGVAAGTLARFAELVFTYIDELSAASVAGYASETAAAERNRAMHLDRLGRALLSGADEPALVAAAESAGWTPPRTLTAVLVPLPRLLNTAAVLDPRTLTLSEDLPGTAGTDGLGALLVPDAGGAARRRLLTLLGGRGAVVGPARPWTEVAASYRRALRARRVDHGGRLRGDVEGLDETEWPVLDSDVVLPALVLGADADALADLRARALQPLDGLPEATAARLAETLRAWLLLQGRRELVAEHLHVHPQTVRYRMNQVRDLYGGALADPDEVLALVLALGVPPA